MLEKQDIYQYDHKIEFYTAKIKASDISEKTKKDILTFKDYLFMRGLSKPRIVKYLEILHTISRSIGKDFGQLTKAEIEQYIGQINQKKYSPWTKQIYRIVLKKYLTWQNKGKVPKTVVWIKTSFSKSEKKLPGDGDMITEAEVNKAMDTCDNARDKCLLSILYESGCRIGEIASLRVGNVAFDKYGAILNVIGKTGSRKIRLVKSTAYLKMHIENHPEKANSAAPLWFRYDKKGRDKPMVYSSFRNLIVSIFERAGIKKRCNPHMFRHSRATYMANHLTEFQMNHYFGWTQGSDMPSTYVHLSGRDVEGAVLAMNGMAPKEESKESEKPLKCPRCELINPANSKYCLRCSQILDEKTAAQHDAIQERQNVVNMVLNELIKEPTIQQALLQRVTEMGLSSSVLGFK